MNHGTEATLPQAAPVAAAPAPGTRAAIENAIAARRAAAQKELKALRGRTPLHMSPAELDRVSKLFGLRTIINPQALIDR